MRQGGVLSVMDDTRLRLCVVCACRDIASCNAFGIAISSVSPEQSAILHPHPAANFVSLHTGRLFARHLAWQGANGYSA